MAPVTHLWGPGGSVWLDDTEMADAYATRARSLRRLIKLYDTEITKLDARIVEEFKDNEGYDTIQQLNGVGPVLAAIDGRNRGGCRGKVNESWKSWRSL